MKVLLIKPKCTDTFSPNMGVVSETVPDEKTGELKPVNFERRLMPFPGSEEAGTCLPNGIMIAEFDESLLGGDQRNLRLYTWDGSHTVLLNADRVAWEKEQADRARRANYMDAYRKYQAAVNYGEFERDYEVDVFIDKLYDKDWSAYDAVPPQLQYFSGEKTLAESTLVSNEAFRTDVKQQMG